MNALDSPGVSVTAEDLLRIRQAVRNDRGPPLRPGGRPGGFVRKRKGSGVEIADVRVFSPGDDIRHIDRNSTARTGVLHARTFMDEREKTALLVADFRSVMLWGTRRAFRSVAAAEVLAAIGWQAAETGGRVGLLAIGPGEPVVVPARPGARGMLAVIGGLAAAHREAVASSGGPQPKQDATLDRALAMAAGLAVSHAAVFLASSFERVGDEFEARAAALAKRTSLTFLHVQDPFERSPPAGSYAYLTDAAGVTRATVRKGATPEAADRRIPAWQRYGIATVAIDSGQEIAANLRTLGRSGGRVG